MVLLLLILFATPILLWSALYLLRLWMRGPTTGSDSKVWLEDRVVVITGSNSGIGKVTAHEISKKGAKLIMLCRNVESANACAREITKDTGHQVEVMKLNLASLDSIRECANTLLQQEDKIDILINNAGIMACPELKTEDGLEMQMGTNHFGHFLLTEMLLPLLRKSAVSGFTPRIVNVSSMAHRDGKMNWDDLHYQKMEGTYKPFLSYGQSKLANILHAVELSRRVEKDGIHVYSLHPGVIITELWKHMEKWGLPFKLLMAVLKYVTKTPYHGAQTTLYCAMNPAAEKETGLYYSDCAPKRPSKAALDEQSQKRLWTISEQTVGLVSDTVDDEKAAFRKKMAAMKESGC